jgi:hypothetical protein
MRQLLHRAAKKPLPSRGLHVSPKSTEAADESPPIQPEPPPVRLENTRTIEIKRFIPGEQLDPRYYNTNLLQSCRAMMSGKRLLP